MRYREERILGRLATRLPLKMKENAMFNDPHVKTNLLLQAHFSRLALPADLQSDQEMVLKLMPRLIAACVDVLSSSSWLEPALAAMELSQMVTQAVWSTDPLLRQLPHVSSELLKRAKDKKVETIFELTDLEDDDRNYVLGMTDQQMADVARFCNRYPNIALEYAVENAEEATVGEPVSLVVSLDRDEDEPDDAVVGPVIAPFFPHRKEESWWLVIGQPNRNQYVEDGRRVGLWGGEEGYYLLQEIFFFWHVLTHVCFPSVSLLNIHPVSLVAWLPSRRCRCSSEPKSRLPSSRTCRDRTTTSCI